MEKRKVGPDLLRAWFDDKLGRERPAIHIRSALFVAILALDCRFLPLHGTFSWVHFLALLVACSIVPGLEDIEKVYGRRLAFNLVAVGFMTVPVGLGLCLSGLLAVGNLAPWGKALCSGLAMLCFYVAYWILMSLRAALAKANA